MSRRNHKLLLYLLLLLVSLSPLRSFAIPTMAEAAMHDCQQMQMSMSKRHHAQQDKQVCGFCQSPGCDDGQCNMALCSAVHAPVAFLVFSPSGTPNLIESLPAIEPDDHLPDRSEPPLIRPPIRIS